MTQTAAAFRPVSFFTGGRLYSSEASSLPQRALASKITSFCALSASEVAIGNEVGTIFTFNQNGACEARNIADAPVAHLEMCNDSLVALVQYVVPSDVLSDATKVNSTHPTIRFLNTNQRTGARARRQEVIIDLDPLVLVTSFKFSKSKKVLIASGLTLEQLKANKDRLDDVAKLPDDDKEGTAKLIPTSTLLIFRGDVTKGRAKLQTALSPVRGVITDISISDIDVGSGQRLLHIYYATAPAYRRFQGKTEYQMTPFYFGEVSGVAWCKGLKTLVKPIQLARTGGAAGSLWDESVLIEGGEGKSKTALAVSHTVLVGSDYISNVSLQSVIDKPEEGALRGVLQISGASLQQAASSTYINKQQNTPLPLAGQKVWSTKTDKWILSAIANSYSDVLNSDSSVAFMGYPMEKVQRCCLTLVETRYRLQVMNYDCVLGGVSALQGRVPTILALVKDCRDPKTVSKYVSKARQKEPIKDIRGTFELVRFRPVSEKERLDELLKRGMFDVAISMCDAGGVSHDNKVRMLQQYANILFERGQSEQAMDCFINAFNTSYELAVKAAEGTGKSVTSLPNLDVSAIVRKFVDGQQIPPLARLLERMHELGMAAANHTLLLLTIYSRWGLYSKAKSFVRKAERAVLGFWERQKVVDGDAELGSLVTADGRLSFDAAAAVETLRAGGFALPAMRLALVAGLEDKALGILIGDANEMVQDICHDNNNSPELAGHAESHGTKRGSKSGVGASSSTDRGGADLERDNYMFPCVAGALALLCSLPAKIIYLRLPEILSILLRHSPSETKLFLAHICSGWRPGAFSPFAPSVSSTPVGSRASMSLDMLAAVTIGIPSSSNSATTTSTSQHTAQQGVGSSAASTRPVSTSNLPSLSVAGGATSSGAQAAQQHRPTSFIFGPYAKTWGKTYCGLRDIWANIGHEVGDSSFLELMDVSLPVRHLPNGEVVEYIPITPLLPHIADHDATIECGQMDSSAPVMKELLLSITEYGNNHPGFRRPQGIRPLGRTVVPTIIVHSLMECFFKEIHSAQTDAAAKGMHINEDNYALEQLDDNGKGGLIRLTPELESIQNRYKSASCSLLEVLNDKYSPEEQEARANLEATTHRSSGVLGSLLPYNPGHVLHLARMFSYPPAALRIHVAQGDTLAQMTHHMLQGDTKAVLDVYWNATRASKDGKIDGTSNATNQPLFWEEVVRYLVEQDESDALETFLSQISERVEPLAIIRVLSGVKDKAHKALAAARLSITKSFQEMHQTLKRGDEATAKATASVADNLRRNEEKKGDALIYQSNMCDSCGQNLSLPSVLFSCGHCMHRRCFEAEASSLMNDDVRSRASLDQARFYSEPIKCTLCIRNGAAGAKKGLYTSDDTPAGGAAKSFADVAAMMGARHFALMHNGE